MLFTHSQPHSCFPSTTTPPHPACSSTVPRPKQLLRTPDHCDQTHTLRTPGRRGRSHHTVWPAPPQMRRPHPAQSSQSTWRCLSQSPTCTVTHTHTTTEHRCTRRGRQQLARHNTCCCCKPRALRRLCHSSDVCVPLRHAAESCTSVHISTWPAFAHSHEEGCAAGQRALLLDAGNHTLPPAADDVHDVELLGTKVTLR